MQAEDVRDLEEKDVTLLVKKAMGANYDRQASEYWLAVPSYHWTLNSGETEKNKIFDYLDFLLVTYFIYLFFFFFTCWHISSPLFLSSFFGSWSMIQSSSDIASDKIKLPKVGPKTSSQSTSHSLPPYLSVHHNIVGDGVPCLEGEDPLDAFCSFRVCASDHQP